MRKMLVESTFSGEKFGDIPSGIRLTYTLED